ncbi:hypothetical protein BDW75DRAFT_175897 [Aspergillus navahoensis]
MDTMLAMQLRCSRPIQIKQKGTCPHWRKLRECVDCGDTRYIALFLSVALCACELPPQLRNRTASVELGDEGQTRQVVRSAAPTASNLQMPKTVAKRFLVWNLRRWRKGNIEPLFH